MEGELSQLIEFRFSLHPMTNDFISVIKGALKATDTTTVWMHTDDVSTVIRGKQLHVFNVAKAIANHAAKTGHHVALSGTFSTGYQRDTATDVYLNKDDDILNTDCTRQYVSSQFALYPMNNPSYKEMIHAEVSRAKECGLFNESMQYANGIHGDIHDVFMFYEEAFTNSRSVEDEQLVMTVSMSINSPSHTGK